MIYRYCVIKPFSQFCRWIVHDTKTVICPPAVYNYFVEADQCHLATYKFYIKSQVIYALACKMKKHFRSKILFCRFRFSVLVKGLSEGLHNLCEVQQHKLVEKTLNKLNKKTKSKLSLVKYGVS